MDERKLITAKRNMQAFIETHQMPDHFEEEVKETLIDPDPDWIRGDQLPDPNTLIPIEPMPLPDEERRIIDESIQNVTLVKSRELQSSPKGEKNMDESFPKYQYSVFLDANKVGQMVIRADSWAEFNQLMTDAGLELRRQLVVDPTHIVQPVAVTPQAPVQPQAVQAQVQAQTMKCPMCGSDMWDNRGRKKNPKAPDFKCKNESCGHAIWPPKA